MVGLLSRPSLCLLATSFEDADARHKPGMTENERTVYAHFIRQHAAAHIASDRRQPRHRPCDRDPLFLSRLARPHLLAPSIPGTMPLGRRTRGSHTRGSVR